MYATTPRANAARHHFSHLMLSVALAGAALVPAASLAQAADGGSSPGEDQVDTYVVESELGDHLTGPDEGALYS